MKKLYCLAWLTLTAPAIADVDCKPIYDSDPVRVEVSAKKGGDSLISKDLVVSGNARSLTQPAERLEFLAGSLSFSLVPILSCHDGLLIEFIDSGLKKKSLVNWGEESTVGGISGSDYFVKVLAKKVP